MVPKELQVILTSKDRHRYQIIDVREDYELQIAKLPDKDVIHLPLSNAPDFIPEIMEGEKLDKSKPTVCICHHGARSLRMCNFLGKLVKPSIDN